MNARFKLVAALSVAATLAFSTANARAAFSLVLGGNTNMSGGPSPDGTFNFGVLSGWATDGNLASLRASFSAGSGSGGLDTSATYLYLYQVVNNGSNTDAIGKATVSLGGLGNTITSFGSFKDFGFTDNNGEVNASNNFGTDGGSFSQNASAHLGVTGPGTTAISGTTVREPSSVTKSTAVFSANFLDADQLEDLNPGQRSILFGFTSNVAPTLRNGALIDGGGANGQVASLAPAPAAWALALSGLVCCSPFLWLRRRNVTTAIA